jgi:hypothetical protein
MAMVVELGWQLEFSFEVKLTWGCVGEVHRSLDRGELHQEGKEKREKRKEERERKKEKEKNVNFFQT